jgi:hypothetical protein
VTEAYGTAARSRVTTPRSTTSSANSIATSVSLSGASVSSTARLERWAPSTEYACPCTFTGPVGASGMRKVPLAATIAIRLSRSGPVDCASTITIDVVPPANPTARP